MPFESDPLSLSNDELAAQITELAGHLNAAQYRWLVLIREFDRRLGWHDGALHSCAHWLNFQCGLALGAARERVRVAHALESLPGISAAMAAGQLSYSKARALTRVACAATESYFLSIALHGTAEHVERLTRAYRRAQQVELSREAHQQALRELRYGYEEDGSIVIRVRLPALTGALVFKALDAAAAALPDTDAADATPDQVPNHMRPSEWAWRRADALALMAERFLQTGTGTGDAVSADVLPLRTADRYQVVVHVSADALVPGHVGHESRCEIEEGTSLPVDSVRRLACDAGIVKLLENAQGEPLEISRKSRTIPSALRRYLAARDRGCRFPGCTHTRYVDAHHIKHWADGGETKASNLIVLCRYHHRLVHEGGIIIETLDDGALRYRRPDGRPYEEQPTCAQQRSDWRKLYEIHAEQRLAIDADSATTLWRGERMDYGLAVQVLLHQESTGNVSAGTCVSAESAL